MKTALAAACLAATVPVIAADAPSPAAAGDFQPQGGLVLQIGNFDVFALIDRQGAYPAAMMRGKQSQEQWDRARHLLTPDMRMRSPLGGYLIRDKASKRLLLVDLGMGPYAAPPVIPAGEHHLIEELQAVGYKPTDITDVILTHLHLDHIGWASVDGKSTFPNAKYWVHQAEWDHAMKNQRPDANPSVELTRSVLRPIERQLHTFSGERETPLPGVTIRYVPGHTPGSTIVQLDSGGRRALILGDTAHTAMSLQDKSWPGMFDTDEAQGLAAKNALIDEAIATDADVSAAHISGMRFGHIVMTKSQGLMFYYNEK